MNMVRVNGPIGLRSLWISLSSYSLSLIFFLISLSLSNWTVYQSIQIKIGLWKVCDIRTPAYDHCAKWSDRIYPGSISNSTFHNGAPDFVSTSQVLVLISLTFYVIAGFLLIAGLLNRSMGLLFFSSSVSIFLTIIFSTSTICLFAFQGKSLNDGHLSHAWWIAIFALFLSIIYMCASFILSFYIQPPNVSIQNTQEFATNDKMFYTLPPYSTDLYMTKS